MRHDLPTPESPVIGQSTPGVSSSALKSNSDVAESQSPARSQSLREPCIGTVAYRVHRRSEQNVARAPASSGPGYRDSLTYKDKLEQEVCASVRNSCQSARTSMSKVV